MLSLREALGAEHAQQGVVGVSHRAGGIERKHSGGNALEDRLHLAAALVEFCVGRAGISARSLILSPAGFEFLSHPVEGAHQISNFIGGSHVDAVIETSARNCLRRLGKRGQRTSHQLREKQRQPRSYEQNHHRQQQQQAHVGLPYVFALAAELQITLLAGFDLAYRPRKLWRQWQSHQDQAVFPNRSAAERVLSLLPGETRGLCRGGLGQRQPLL